MFVDELFVLDELVAQKLLEMTTNFSQARDPVDHIARQMEAIKIVQDGHVKGSRCRTLFFVAAHMQVVVVRSAIGETVD